MKKLVKLLLVEDSAADARLLTTAFSRIGFEGDLHHVTSGEDAVVFLSESSEVHLVILDLNLPGMSGLEVLARVKGDLRLRRHPVAILSTSDAPADVEHALDLHANAYFQKPGEFSEIVELARALLNLWSRRALLAPIG